MGIKGLASLPVMTRRRGWGDGMDRIEPKSPMSKNPRGDPSLTILNAHSQDIIESTNSSAFWRRR